MSEKYSTVATSPSRRKNRKRLLLDRLQRRDIQAVCRQARSDRTLPSALIALVLHDDPLIRWRAIESLGQVAADLSRRDLDYLRDLVRRQFWSLNDDSGNIGWHTPEVIAEILRAAPPLAREFFRLLASYRHTPPFEQGVQWALYRLAPSCPELFGDHHGDLIGFLEAEQPLIRGLAAATLGLLRFNEAAPALSGLVEDHAPLWIYDFDAGDMKQHTVGRLAQQALESLRVPR